MKPMRAAGRAFVGVLATWLAGLALAVSPAAGQDPAGPKPFTAEELEQIVAPIALYPDGLLAQVFMASTYPLEVVQAARFMKENPNLKDQALNEALQKQSWDDSVKFIVSVPQALNMMNEKLDWTQKLGDAFLGQRKETMDAVQRLRTKAQASGNLKSTPEQTVKVEPAAPAAAPAPTTVVTAPAPTQTIVIEQTNPQVVYVPTYNPTVVYGAWPYPAYPPYYYYPPGYIAGAAITFGVGMAVGAAVWGGCNWGGGDVDIDVNKSNNFNKTVNRGDRQTTRGDGGGGRQNFQHNPEHRKGVQYRDSATQQRFNKSGPAGAEGRQDFRGRGDGGAQGLDRGGRGEAGRAPSTADRGRQGGQAGGGRDLGGAGSQGGRDFGGAGSGGGAFQGMDHGRDAKSYSQRGQSSLGSAKAGGGLSGGGARATAGGGQRGGGGRGRR